VSNLPTSWAPLSVAPRYRFGKHDRITVKGIDYCCANSDQTGHLFRRLDNIDLAERFSHEEIARLMKADELVARRDWFRAANANVRGTHGETLLTGLDKEEQRKVLWRQTYCDQFLQMERTDKEVSRSDVSMLAAIARIANVVANLEVRRQSRSRRCGSKISVLLPPSPTSLRDWLTRYEAAGWNPIVLRDRYGRSGNRNPRFDAESIRFAKEFAQTYANENKPTKVMVFGEYDHARKAKNKEIEAANEHLPVNERTALLKGMSSRSFDALIDRLAPVFVCAAREGADAARKKFGPEWGGLEVTRPLERVEMDEWFVSLQVLLIDAGIWAHLSTEQKAMVARSRVWLSTAIDCATRCLVGLRLLAAAPSSESAISLLEMAVSDKSNLTSFLGLRTAWDQHGRMETVAMDSGSAFVAVATQATILDLGAEPFFPPSGIAELRGRIERIFGHFQQHFLRFFPGQTFENVVKKGDYDSEGHACVDIEELNRTLIAYVVEVYHNTMHEGLAGETPRNAWLRLTQKYGVLPPPDPTTRRHIFGIACERRIRNKGIRILGIHYQSRALQNLRRTVGQRDVLVRVDRFDLGEISVRTKDGWLTVKPAIDRLNLSGVTYWEWVAAWSDLRRKNVDVAKLSLDVVHAAIESIRGTAEMARQRAELGSPVLTFEEFEKIDRQIFPDFGQGGEDDASDDGDILFGDDGAQSSVQPLNAPEAEPPERQPPTTSDEDSFGSEDDWLSEE